MNILIFTSDQKISESLVRCTDYQHQHLQKILKAKINDSIKVGQYGGKIGTAKIVSSDTTETLLEIMELSREAPPRLPLSIILALPRPQMIKRILQTAATMGVQKLILLQSAKVEKSFWQSPSLKQGEIQRQIILGLEQGMATQAPEIIFEQKFKPFFENKLSELIENKRCFLAEQGEHKALGGLAPGKENVFAIGPEGGFTREEAEMFALAGFTPIQLGPRVLKVETALTVVAARFLSC